MLKYHILLSRCGQLREHVSISSPSQETVTVGLEDAPFIFCPFMTDGKSCVEDLNRILRKYALDKYQNTPIENLDDDRLIWHAVSDLPTPQS